MKYYMNTIIGVLALFAISISAPTTARAALFFYPPSGSISVKTTPLHSGAEIRTYSNEYKVGRFNTTWSGSQIDIRMVAPFEVFADAPTYEWYNLPNLSDMAKTVSTVDFPKYVYGWDGTGSPESYLDVSFDFSGYFQCTDADILPLSYGETNMSFLGGSYSAWKSFDDEGKKAWRWSGTSRYNVLTAGAYELTDLEAYLYAGANAFWSANHRNQWSNGSITLKLTPVADQGPSLVLVAFVLGALMFFGARIRLAESR